MLAEQPQPQPAGRVREVETARRSPPQSLLRYRLAEGVELLVEASADAKARSATAELIEAADRIFNRKTDHRQNGGK
jgi:hypothetical protein